MVCHPDDHIRRILNEHLGVTYQLGAANRLFTETTNIGPHPVVYAGGCRGPDRKEVRLEKNGRRHEPRLAEPDPKELIAAVDLLFGVELKLVPPIGRGGIALCPLNMRSKPPPGVGVAVGVACGFTPLRSFQ